MFGGRDSGRESNSSSTANGSTSSGRREGTREGRSKTSFFKKLLPGPWKPRSQGWEEQLQSLPDGMREQVLEQVQGQHAKGKKLRILFDDGENIGSEDIMRATYSGPRVRADPTVLHFFKYGELTYKQALVHGFYAPFGDFPEVAEKDELPQLSELMERCSVLEGREVILIDTQVDNDLRAFLDGPVVEVASAAGDVLMVRVQRVAVLVATRLGGAMTDGALGAQYSTYSQSLQHTQGSTVLLLGSLSVGTSCHRALLAKLALLRVGITSAIRPTANSRIDGVAPPKQLFWQMEGSVEYVVNLTDRPGELTQVSAHATVPSNAYAALAAQATPPQSGQAAIPPGMPPQPALVAQAQSHGGTHAHATPPGSPKPSTSSNQPGAQPLQPPAAVYDALATLPVEPARHSSASTHPALSRGGSAASLMTDATGGRGPVIGGVPMPTDLGTQLDATDTSGTAEPAHSSFSGVRGIRGSDSPRAGGSLPLEVFQRGGSMTPPRSLSPTPTTFINRLPNPFAPGMAEAASAATLAASTVSAGSGLSTQVSMSNTGQQGASQQALAETQSMPAQSGAAQTPGGGITGATAATSAAVVAAALGGPPRIVAWPFGNPEILSVAVRMQSRSGHGGSRRRGAGGNSAGALSTSTVDDTHNHSTLSDRQRERERERERDRERAHNEAVLWMSTESSTGAGGGLNGSFLGGDSGAVNSTAGGTHGATMRHTTHATHASQLASGLGRPTGVGATSHSSHSLSNLPDAGVGGVPGVAQSLQDLSPPSLQHAAAHSSPTLFGDYGAAVGALSGGWEGAGGPVGSASVPTLPQSISASGAAPAATSSSGGGSSRRRHRHRLASAFEGSGELRAGAAEAFQNIPQPRISPSRPPVPPSARSALSANTASPPHGSPILDAPLEAWPSSNAAPRLSELDLRPDTAAGPSAVPSEEMAAWWHGSSRFEVLTQASDPSRYSGSDVLGHGGGRTPGGGDSSIAASSGMDGAGFSGSGLGALASGPPPSGSMSVTPSARHATTKGGAFGDAAGGNGSDTDLDEAASGTVQKFPPIPEAPERWGIGVVSALPTGFGDDDSDGFDGAGSTGGAFSNPTGHGRFDMRESGGSANLDMSSTVATPAATSTPTRTHSPLSAAGQEAAAAATQHRRRSSGAGGGHGGPVPAAGFASIFRGAFDDDDGGGDTGEADDEPALFAPGGATSGSGSRSPQHPRPGLPHAPRHSSGSYRSAPPATPDDDGTLASDDSQHSDSSLSRGGVSGVARPYAGRLLSPFGEDEDDGEESEEENDGGALANDPRSSGSGTDGLGMLQPLPGAFGGGGGVASNLLSPFADNDAGTSGEVSIHSNRIPPVGGGAGSSSLTPPRTPTPARDISASTGTLNTTGTGTGTTPRRFGSRNGNSFRSDASASNSRGAVAMQPYTALPKGSANPQNTNALPSDSPYDPSSSAADGGTPGTHVDHSVNLDNVPELDFARSSSGRPGFPPVDMSGAISLDHNSTALPSAEANLRALMQNTSIHTLEAQFRMWINTSDITMTETVIGRGSYGQVMLAKFRTERCAVKQIVCETKAEYRAAMQEMLLMQELQFDKIVRFFGAIKRGRGVLWMCMEYMPFSDLRKILHNAEHRRTVRFAESMLSLPRRLKWAKDVVAALDLLHSRAVVHRDLKPGNVLISNKGDAVLSDFGLSRVREAQQSRLQASGPGTVSYAAPEALQANQVSPASDMFSFGCVLWELLSMKEPWAELHGATFQIMSKICHEKASLRVEDIAQDVRETVPNVIAELRKCLSFDPEQRPSAEHVYEVLDDAIESL